MASILTVLPSKSSKPRSSGNALILRALPGKPPRGTSRPLLSKMSPILRLCFIQLKRRADGFSLDTFHQSSVSHHAARTRYMAVHSCRGNLLLGSRRVGKMDQLRRRAGENSSWIEVVVLEKNHTETGSWRLFREVALVGRDFISTGVFQNCSLNK